MELDDNLKQLMKQLGAAINDSLTESESVSEAMGDIREAGYDIFLILEATIGFNARTSDKPGEGTAMQIESGDLVLSAQDAKFLKSLRICLSSSDESLPKRSGGSESSLGGES